MFNFLHLLNTETWLSEKKAKRRREREREQIDFHDTCSSKMAKKTKCNNIVIMWSVVEIMAQQLKI